MRSEQSDSGTSQQLVQGCDGPGAAVPETSAEQAPCGRVAARSLGSYTRAIELRPAAELRLRRDLVREAFRRVREYVDADPGSRLDVSALARMVGLSASHFSRAFQKAVGVPPHRYVVQRRVIRAKELLATTRLSLTEIALTSGFADHSHFSRRFHELTGVAPREFRRLAAGTPR